MFENPFGASVGKNPDAMRSEMQRMIPMLFKMFSGGRDITQDPRMGQFNQKMGIGAPSQPGMQQPGQQQPNPMMSGISSMLTPNNQFMMNALKGIKGQNGPNVGATSGPPIANTPSINGGNSPFMQMPWAKGANNGQ